VPDAKGASPIEITHMVLGTWKDLVTYLVVAVYMAVFWTAHVYTFAVIQSSDSVIAFSNIFLMMFISVLPWVISIVRSWPYQIISSMLYNGILFMISFTMLMIWLYSVYKRRFVHDERDLPVRAIRIVTARFAFSPIVYCIGFAIAPASTLASLIISGVVPIVFMLSNFGFDIFEYGYVAGHHIKRFIKGKSKSKPNLHEEEPNPSAINHAEEEQKEHAEKVKEVKQEQILTVNGDGEQTGDVAIVIEDVTTTVVSTQVDDTIITHETISVVNNESGDANDDEPKVQLTVTTVTNGDSITTTISRENEPFVFSTQFHDLVMERIKGFSDAVFAIVITILVLKMHAPEHSPGEEDSDKVLGDKILEVWPLYAAFVISVILVRTNF
jgi:uncharacterized membrane protein